MLWACEARRVGVEAEASVAVGPEAAWAFRKEGQRHGVLGIRMNEGTLESDGYRGR